MGMVGAAATAIVLLAKGSYTNHVATKGGGGSSKNHNTT